ncbi:hypothetical protein AC1031_013802 [Aphanomyces cochlioides]|nr:hypothetical protein AC1031_013802 [Aphanomyces cochlioides]
MVLLKRGYMYKRGSGQRLFSKKNWKKRYFELSQDDLRYFDGERGTLKGVVDLSECTSDALEIMVDSCETPYAPPSKWRLAITSPSRRFFMAFASESEMNAWAFAFLEAFKLQEESGRKTYTADGHLRTFVKEQRVHRRVPQQG